MTVERMTEEKLAEALLIAAAAHAAEHGVAAVLHRDVEVGQHVLTVTELVEQLVGEGTRVGVHAADPADALDLHDRPVGEAGDPLEGRHAVGGRGGILSPERAHEARIAGVAAVIGDDGAGLLDPRPEGIEDGVGWRSAAFTLYFHGKSRVGITSVFCRYCLGARG